jgi:predicted Zn finger-like uncharacterized protein
MNVRCPDCRTVYRVDPAKVPGSGIRARCARCPGEFDVRVDREDSPPTATAPTSSGTFEGSREAYREGERSSPTWSYTILIGGSGA